MRRAASSLTKTVVKPLAKGDLGRKKLHLDIIPIDSATLLATCDISNFNLGFHPTLRLENLSPLPQQYFVYLYLFEYYKLNAFVLV